MELKAGRVTCGGRWLEEPVFGLYAVCTSDDVGRVTVGVLIPSF